LPAISVIRLGSGDALLLTSDGVHDNLSSSEITQFLDEADPATTLVQAADARSGESALPHPEDLGAPFNYRAHPDDASAMLIRLG
jgi:serine/threonine protein phosphatase PrpC